MNMNDVIYAQIRRNFILPFKSIFVREEQEHLRAHPDLLQGSANLISQFRPKALGPANAR